METLPITIAKPSETNVSHCSSSHRFGIITLALIRLLDLSELCARLSSVKVTQHHITRLIWIWITKSQEKSCHILCILWYFVTPSPRAVVEN